MKWPGLVPLGRKVLYGSRGEPKATYSKGITGTTSEAYESMNKYYRWFRQDELVRRCLVTNAFFACLTKGFETVIEPSSPDLTEQENDRLLEDYGYVKANIDEYNKRVNLDLVLFVAQIKRSIYGKVGFEIVLDPDDYFPGRLIALKSTSLKPNVNKNWELTGFGYEGKEGFYEPGEVLYFTNLGLDADYEGLSDIEGIIDICKARHETLRKDIPEIIMSLWAPFLLLKADTSGLSKEDADKALDALVKATKPGKRVVVNESVEGEVLDMKPDIPGLTHLLDKFEDRIIGNFQTPRFLVGKPIENRATAYAELEAYVGGPIASIQRYFKREVERQWYDPLVDQVVMKEERLPHSAISSLRKAEKNIPVVLKHRWNPVRIFDIYQLADAVAKLWGSHGMGPVGDHREKVWDLMGWDPAELEEEEK